MPDLTAKLLVAAPSLDDPNFRRTVVFLLAHGEMGALGVVLNRPSEGTVDEILPVWSMAAAPPGRVFVGGPVSLDSVIGLGWVDGEPDPEGGFTSVLGPAGTIDLHQEPADLGDDLRFARLFAGSAGWAAAQLENEIAEGAWFVVDAEPTDVFTPDPDDLWRTVLRRQPGKLAWYANAVGDTRFN